MPIPGLTLAPHACPVLGCLVFLPSTRAWRDWQAELVKDALPVCQSHWDCTDRDLRTAWTRSPTPARRSLIIKFINESLADQREQLELNKTRSLWEKRAIPNGLLLLAETPLSIR